MGARGCAKRRMGSCVEQHIADLFDGIMWTGLALPVPRLITIRRSHPWRGRPAGCHGLDLSSCRPGVGSRGRFVAAFSRPR